MPAQDPPATMFHMRVTKDLSGALAVYKDMSGVAIAHHIPDNDDPTPHIHIWIETVEPCTKMTIKNRLQGLWDGAWTMKGQKDWMLKVHDSFVNWYTYVYGAEGVRIRRGEATEWLYNVTNPRPFVLPTVVDLRPIAYNTTQTVRVARGPTPTEKFVAKCKLEFDPSNGEDIDMGEIVEAYTSFTKNRINVNYAKPVLQFAFWELNPHRHDDIKRANRNYFTMPSNWNGLTFY